MSEGEDRIDPHFMQLVMSMQAGAMQQMGKMASPISGKVERDLNMAKYSIDILGMIQTKTKGNLTDEEDKILGHVLYELRLNYVDELKKARSGQDKQAEGEESETEQAKSAEAPTSASEDSEEIGPGGDDDSVGAADDKDES